MERQKKIEKNEKPKDIRQLLRSPSKNIVKRSASGKEDMFFEQIGANLAHIQAENLQNVHKSVFLANATSRAQWVEPVINNYSREY